MRRLLLPVLVLVALIVLATLLLAIPAGAAEREQPSAREGDWSNLERLPAGVPLLVEDIDGTLHRGRFLAVTDDAISIGQRKRVVGIGRDRVERIWLRGERQTGKYAAVGALTLGVLGALTAGLAYAGQDDAGGATFIVGLMTTGAGAGVGAALGASVRERTLLYRAPPKASPKLPKAFAPFSAESGLGSRLAFSRAAGSQPMAPGMLLLAIPAGVSAPETPQAAASGWNNLYRFPVGTPIILRDIEGRRHKGRLVAVAEDAISLRQGKAVVGVARERVARIWLVGERKVGEGAVLGALVAGVGGAILAATAAGRSSEPAGASALFGGVVLGGAGAGAGAAVGAVFRERALIYRAPPDGADPGKHPTGRANSLKGDASMNWATCSLSLDTVLPIPFRDVCQVFRTERAAEEIVGKLFPQGGRP